MLLYKSAWPNGLDGLADQQAEQPCCCNVHTRERGRQAWAPRACIRSRCWALETELRTEDSSCVKLKGPATSDLLDAQLMHVGLLGEKPEDAERTGGNRRSYRCSTNRG